MTKRDLESIRRKLLAERERVLDSLRRNKQHALLDIDDTTRDAGDLATANHDRGILYGLQESEMKNLRRIDEVLARIDHDGYGTCEECGGEIRRARLEAIPWATTCLACQEQADLVESLSRIAGIDVLERDKNRVA